MQPPSVLKVGIVGAEEKKWALTYAQKEAQRIITKVLTQSYYFCTICGWKFQWPHVVEHKEFTVELKPGLMVSGHCPVGQERFYCRRHQVWKDTAEVCDSSAYSPIADGLCWGETATRAYDKGGVDTWAEIIADGLGIKKLIFPPETFSWENKQVFTVEQCSGIEHHYNGDPLIFPHVHFGYKARNQMIGSAVNILYVISPRPLDAYSKQRVIWNGGEWTANYTEKLGKEVYRIAI